MDLGKKYDEKGGRIWVSELIYTPGYMFKYLVQNVPL